MAACSGVSHPALIRATLAAIWATLSLRPAKDRPPRLRQRRPRFRHFRRGLGFLAMAQWCHHRPPARPGSVSPCAVDLEGRPVSPGRAGQPWYSQALPGHRWTFRPAGQAPSPGLFFIPALSAPFPSWRAALPSRPRSARVAPTEGPRLRGGSWMPWRSWAGGRPSPAKGRGMV